MRVGAVGFAASLSLGCFEGAGRGDDPELERRFARSLQWLDAHAPDPRRDPVGALCLDAWTWYVFSAWHPEEHVRERAGREVDRRLAALEPPRDLDVVKLSYWATLWWIMKLRGRQLDPAALLPARTDLDAIVSTAHPTTRWWIEKLLEHVGLPVEPDFTRTLIHGASAGPAAYTPTLSDAYRIYHEIAPATGLGAVPFAGFDRAQTEFVLRVLPGLIEVGRDAGDTDAVAEVLIAAALMGERDTAAYRDGIAWLLGRQREDGTYWTAGDSMTPPDPHESRHGVLVVSWALLTSLERFEPRVAALE